MDLKNNNNFLLNICLKKSDFLANKTLHYNIIKPHLSKICENFFVFQKFCLYLLLIYYEQINLFLWVWSGQRSCFWFNESFCIAKQAASENTDGLHHICLDYWLPDRKATDGEAVFLSRWSAPEEHCGERYFHCLSLWDDSWFYSCGVC